MGVLSKVPLNFNVIHKSSQTPSVRWTNPQNNTNPLTNDSTLFGPHVNVSVEWPELKDQVNLTLEKGNLTKIIDSIPSRSLLSDHRKNISFYVIEGDFYNLSLDWNTGWNLDWRFFDPSNSLISNYGCDPEWPRHEIDCSTNKPEIITNFVPSFTGNLIIEVNVYSSTSTPNFAAYSLQVDNYQRLELSMNQTDIVTIDTAQINESKIWNGNLTLTSIAQKGAIIESSVLRINTMNWFPPTIDIFALNNEKNSCLFLDRSNNNLITWNVSDINVPRDETLRYYLKYRKPNVTLWEDLDSFSQGSTQTSFIWENLNYFIYPSGDYLISITASDSHYNKSKEIIFFLDITNQTDTDLDNMPSMWECSMNLDPLVDDSSQDYDNDGLPNLWEYQMGLNASNFDDFDLDRDKDSMDNFWEYQMGLNASNPLDAFEDLDGDGMINRWEYQMRLNASNPFDDQWDKDSDGISNYYEYIMDLNAIEPDDAIDDLDLDGLTNLEEFRFGSWANISDTDQDGMLDLFEYQMQLNPNFDDAELDKDNDGMTNLWEFMYSFNATDPMDAKKDSDGDGLTNIQEFKSNTNPRDFWSVPLISPSYTHLSIGTIFLIILSCIYLSFYYRNSKRKALITHFDAPDYETATKIKKSGYSDLSSFILADSEAKTFIESGNSLFFEGEYLESIQNYEQALTIFERLDKSKNIAETVFKVVRVQKELNLLSKESSILRRFPKEFSEFSIQNSFNQMIQALIAEKDGNWGLAEKAWKKTLNNDKLDLEYKMMCQGALIESEFRNWVLNPVEDLQETFFDRVNKWIKDCEENQLIEGRYQAYLLHAKIALSKFQLKEADQWLDKCLSISTNKKLKIYDDIASERKNNLVNQKQTIKSIKESTLFITPEEQEKEMFKYINKALRTIEKEKRKKRFI
jgi:tetratricopeptide (TPR) repeat protein